MASCVFQNMSARLVMVAKQSLKPGDCTSRLDPALAERVRKSAAFRAAKPILIELEDNEKPKELPRGQPINLGSAKEDTVLLLISKETDPETLAAWALQLEDKPSLVAACRDRFLQLQSP